MGNIVSPHGRSRLPFKAATPAGSLSPTGPASSVVSEITFGQSAAVGSSLKFARQDHTHGTPPLTELGTGGIVGWCINSNIIAPQSNPTAATYVHAHKIYLPHGMTFKAYGFGLTRNGVKTDGNMYLSIWSHDATNNSPYEEYESARVIGFAPAYAAYWNRAPLQAHGVSSVTIDEGYAWVIKTIEVAYGRTELPLEWWDGGACGTGHALYQLIAGQGAFPTDTWDYASNVATRRTPGVLLLDY